MVTVFLQGMDGMELFRLRIESFTARIGSSRLAGGCKIPPFWPNSLFNCVGSVCLLDSGNSARQENTGPDSSRKNQIRISIHSTCLVGLLAVPSIFGFARNRLLAKFFSGSLRVETHSKNGDPAGPDDKSNPAFRISNCRIIQ